MKKISDVEISLKEHGLERPVLKIFGISAVKGGKKDAFCLQEASRASPQVVPGSREARQMTAGFGRKLSALLVKPSPVGACLKTLLGSTTWGSTEYLLTWKASATRSGRLKFRLVPSTPRRSGKEFGSWGTPRAVRGGYCTNMTNPENPILTLEGQIKATWPTPREAKTTAEEMETWHAGNPKHRLETECRMIGQATYGPLAQTESFVERLIMLSCWLQGYTLDYISKWERKR